MQTTRNTKVQEGRSTGLVVRRRATVLVAMSNGKFKDLGTLGGFNATATVINDAGQIVGGSHMTTTIDLTVATFFAIEHSVWL